MFIRIYSTRNFFYRDSKNYYLDQFKTKIKTKLVNILEYALFIINNNMYVHNSNRLLFIFMTKVDVYIHID